MQKNYFTGTYGIVNQDAWNLLSDGDISINFYAQENVDHINSTEITIIKDNTPPEIAITTPIEEYYFSNNLPEFSLEIIEKNLNSNWYTIGSNPTKFYFTSTHRTIDQVPWETIEDGFITIEFYASDLAGNVNSNTIKIIKYTELPQQGIPGNPLVLIIGINIINIDMIIIFERRKIIKNRFD